MRTICLINYVNFKSLIMKNNLCSALTSLVLLFLPFLGWNQAPDLGASAGFAVFTSTGAFNVSGASTRVVGDVGTNVGAFNGFPPGVLVGAKHVADPASSSAATSVGLAYSQLAGAACSGGVLSSSLGNGQTLSPNTYCIGEAATLNGTLTLNGGGNPGGVFIIQIDGAFAANINSRILLTGGADVCNVYWQISGMVTLDGNSSFAGTIVAGGAISFLGGASLNGRALTRAGAISLANNTVTLPVATPAVITAGSAIALCEGQQVVLSSNIPGVWSNSATTSSITVTTAGDYFITTTNGCGSVNSNHIVVTVSPAPVASVITAGGPVSFCAGSGVTLSGNVGGVWSTGETGSSINVTAAGDYFVTTTNSCGSVVSNHIAVTVNPLPTVSVISASGPIAFCAGGSVTLSGNAGGTWNTGATTPSITVTTAGDYFVTTVNSCGTVISNHINVTISPVLTAATITASGPVSFCAGGSVTLSGNNGGVWSTGATTPTITVSASGDYSVTSTNSCGSVTSNHIVVSINPLPVVSVISASGPISFCTGGSVTLSGNNGGTWSTGATTPTIVVTTAGNYSVTNTNACGSVTSNQIVVVVNSPLIASVITAGGATTFCTGQSVVLSGNTGGGVWSNGSTSSSITVVSSGDYFVVNTNACGSVTSNHIIVNVSAPTTPSVITANDAIVFCLGDSVTLSGNVNGTWNTGSTAPSIVVKTSGEYFVTNTDSCGNVSSNHIIVKVDLPPAVSVITASDTTAFCAPRSVTLSGNVAGIWNTGATTPSIVVTTSGDYFVTTANSCATLVSNHILVTVHPLPVASVITSDHTSDTICLGDSIILSGNVGGVWNNGSTSSSIIVKHSGTFFTTNSNFCDTVSSNIIQIVLDSIPSRSIIVASGPTIICTGDSVVLTGNTGGIWNTGATTSSIIVKTSGDYFVTQIHSCDSGISNHIQVQVKIRTNPLDRIIVRDTICADDSITLSGNAGGTWNTGDTTSTIIVKTTGVYFLIDENACDSIGLNTVTILTVVARPVQPLILSDTICLGDEITLGSPSIAGHTYKWSTNYGIFVSSQANPKVRPQGTTTYVLKETTVAGGCQATNSVKITVGPLPSCVIKGNNIICQGQSTQLCAPAGPFTYLWNTGETTSCITVDSIGNYSVVVTSLFGCSSRCSRNVIAGEGPCDISGTALIYAGQSSQFCAPAGYTSYSWSTGETTRCITVKTAGTYTLTATNARGCTSVCSKILTVAPAVYCEIIGDTVICPNSVATLCAVGVPGNSYYWSNGQVTQCIEINCEGTYSVQVTNNGASSICVIKVKVAPALPALSSCIISGNLNPNTGDSTTLCAPLGFFAYLWSTGATSRCIKVGKSGTYQLKVSNAGGCYHTCAVVVNYPSSSRRSTGTAGAIIPAVTAANTAHFEIKAYPNPFNATAHFEFQTDQTDSQVRLEVTGLAGNKIATLFDGKVEKGLVYKVRMDGSQLAEGVYIYKIINGNQTISKKLILIR